jgi:hypothetical protein
MKANRLSSYFVYLFMVEINIFLSFLEGGKGRGRPAPTPKESHNTKTFRHYLIILRRHIAEAS